MKTFFKWMTFAAAAGIGAVIVYTWAAEARARIDRGLERAERIADDTRQALDRTQDALGETEGAVRDIRGTIG